MTVFSYLSVIILIILALVSLAVLVHIVLEKNRKQRILYLRNYKKGKCFAIFVIALPLYFIGYFYDRTPGRLNIIMNLADTFDDVKDLIVLKFKYDGISHLMLDSLAYEVTVYFCSLLVILNAGLFVFSLFQQRIWEKITVNSFLRSNNDKYLIVGVNSDNIHLYNSIESGKKSIIGNATDDERNSFYLEDIVNISSNDEEKVILKLLSAFVKKYNETRVLENKLYIVINTQDDNKNLNIGRVISRFIKENITDTDLTDSDIYLGINILVFMIPKYESQYKSIADTSGCLRVVDKYERISWDMVWNYPLSMHLDPIVDKSSYKINKNAEINVLLVGFGEMNQRLLTSYVATNQFIQDSEDSNNLAIKCVNYHIFDRQHAEYNLNLNHNYLRLKNEFFKWDENNQVWKIRESVDEKAYLPFPDLPANEYYHLLDVNNPDFFANIRNIVTGDQKINYIFVAYGEDIDNRELAQKLVGLNQGWGNDNVWIYSRAKETDYSCENDGIVYFGNESKEIYDMNKLNDSSLLKMALERNKLNGYEKAVSANNGNDLPESKITEIYKSADSEWYKRPVDYMRESNIYATLSIRGKLLLMGMDMKKKGSESNGEERIMSYDDYINRYAGDDMPNAVSPDRAAKFGPGKRSTLEFKDSKAKNLAFLEHLRWNSFMITRGFVPSDLDTIKNEKIPSGKSGEQKFSNGTNYMIRRHGNLTTFDGLIEYRKKMADWRSAPEINFEMIKYDYHILDNAWWVLNMMGYDVIDIRK